MRKSDKRLEALRDLISTFEKFDMLDCAGVIDDGVLRNCVLVKVCDHFVMYDVSHIVGDGLEKER